MKNLKISSSPHISTPTTVRGIMFDMILALLPAGVAAVWLFGLHALLLIITCVGSCVLCEFIMRKLMKRDCTIGDLSAVVTGLLLAYTLPPTLPLWMAALGSAAAIIIAKQLFGGLGQNLVNPALFGTIVLMISFAGAMSDFTEPFLYKAAEGSLAQTSTAAEPLMSQLRGDELPSITQMLIGQHKGALGETCVIALLIGFVYLCVRRIINPLIPVIFVGTVGVCMTINGDNPLYQIMSGSLLLGAIFMATDYVTTPSTMLGKVIFALGCGLITSLIRIYGALSDGVVYAIVFMNVLTPLIDKICVRKPFGNVRIKKERKAASPNE